MISSVGTALSGLQAATQRVGVAAQNIANASTPGYAVLSTRQVSDANGGVIVDVQSGAAVPDQNSVDVANELVGMMTASYDFRANLKTIKITDNMQKSLLDILS